RLADPDLLAEPQGPVPARAGRGNDQLAARPQDPADLLAAVFVLEHLEGDDDVERASRETRVPDVGDDVCGWMQVDAGALEPQIAKKSREPHPSATEVENASSRGELGKKEGELAPIREADRARLGGLSQRSQRFAQGLIRRGSLRHRSSSGMHPWIVHDRDAAHKLSARQSDSARAVRA